MKLTFILITILINLFNPLIIKSEEKIDPSRIKLENSLKKESLKEKKSNLTKIHIVKVGDTLSSISKFYSIDKELIIKLNNLKNENYIFVGQNLVLSKWNQNTTDQITYKNKENNPIHIVQSGENLTEISNKYKLKMEYLIEINKLNNPDSIEVGEKLLLSKNNITNSEAISTEGNNDNGEFINIYKKIYGPLIINSQKLEKLNGRQILNISNQNNKKLILSISCETKELDVRIPGRKWRGWEPAKEEFERNLINDLC